MTGSSNRGLQWLARRASTDPFFAGRALAEYRAMHGIDDRNLAKLLQCRVEDIVLLALCRCPHDQEARFQEDVRRISAFASCNPVALAQLLREVAAVASLRGEAAGNLLQGLLMAARDRRNRGKFPRKAPANDQQDE